MQTTKPSSLSWTDVLAALRECTGEFVLVRDGKVTEPAAAVRNRPSAKGSELCLFPGESPSTRLDLMAGLESQAKNAGRRFMTSARASVNKSFLLVESVADEMLDDGLFAVIKTRRPTLGYNQSQQTGSRTTLRSKRIKAGS